MHEATFYVRGGVPYADATATRDVTIEPYLDRDDCRHIPPVRYVDGGNVVRVFSLDAANRTASCADVTEAFDVTVRSKRELATLDASRARTRLTPLHALTDRQREAVRKAWWNGYYAIPRETTTEAVGDDVGVDRRTIEEHLRIAENELVDAILDAEIPGHASGDDAPV